MLSKINLLSTLWNLVGNENNKIQMLLRILYVKGTFIYLFI